MKSVKPSVTLIGSTVLDIVAVGAYLDYIEDGLADQWLANKQVDDLTLLTEIMGRVCYKSWAPGINPNVTRVRDDTAAYIANLIDQQHGSVFEHATISFIFGNVSRVFTHELVRHRVGTAISQESMRYVRIEEIPFWIPDSLRDLPDNLQDEFYYDSALLVDHMAVFQKKWAKQFELDGSSFERKKQFTSALRRWAPQGIATHIGWTCNVRELRHVIKMRTDLGAEEEIRLVFNKVADICIERWPILFADLRRSQ